MAVRHESVRLELNDAGFSTGMAKNAAATALLARELNKLDGTSVRTHKSMPPVARDVDSLGRSAKSTGPEVDRLSGRMRIMADAAAVLGPSLVPIGAVAVPAITGLSQQLGFAALGMGTLVAASQGVGDALKAVNEAALAPTADNLAKAREAMALIGPDAQAFVQRFQELRPALRDIRDAAAAGWFPGLTDALDSIERVGPEVASLFKQIGTVGGDLVAEGAAAFSGPGWADFRAFVATEAPKSLEDLGRTLGNVAKGLADLWMAFGPLNSSFSSWMLDASRSFADWAEGLSQTEGFREFVDYIQTNGPRVADALVAVSDAALQIIEALAPLGGPSLKIIETFAEVIAKIADSDLGTPIMAGVAALALYNRSLQVTAALQTRLTGSKGIGNALAAGGVLGATKAGAKGARSSLGTLRDDIAVIGSTWATAGAQSERAAARMNAAMNRTKSTLAPIAKSTALVGGLALATSGAADSFGLANTASLAMMGTIAGPWGAAIGGGIGLLIDLAKAAGDTRGAFEDAIKTTNAAAGIGDLATAEAALAQAKKNRDKYLADDRKSNEGNIDTGLALAQAHGQNVSKQDLDDAGITGPSAAAQKAQADYEKASKAVEDLRNEMAVAALAQQGFTSEMLATADAAGVSASELMTSVAAIEAHTAAANGAFSAETSWRQALKAAQEQAANNNAGIKGNTKEALANRSALEGLSSAWANQRDAMVANGESAEAVNRKYRNARKAFIDTATAMGVPIEQARRLAKSLLAIPDQRKVDVTVDDNGALTQVNRIKDAIAALRGKTLTIDVVRRTQGMGKMADAADARGSADGSTVPKDGGTYADRYPYLLAPGEEVISNRHGQADRHRPLLKAINAGLLSDGGTAGLDGWGFLASGGTAGKRGKRKDTISFLGWDLEHQVAVSLKDFIAGLEKSRDTLQSENDARQSLISELGDNVAGKFTSALFGDTNAWSAGGSLLDAIGILNGDTAAANAFTGNVAALQAKGLDDPGALNALLSQADPATIASIAATATPEVIAQYEQAFQVRNAAVESARNTATAAQTATLVAAQAATTARVDQVVAELKELNKSGPKKTGAAAGQAAAQASNRGAGNASRNRNRSSLTP